MMDPDKGENISVFSVPSVAKESMPSPVALVCPLDKVRELHERVMACWRRYQVLSLELLALEGRVADCRKELTATAQAIYELRRISAAALDADNNHKS